ncbi:MAG: hypothetical protein ACI4JN_12830 [Ruminococcus sp.]
MARTVDEVNTSIDDTNRFIAEQGALIGVYQKQIEQNNEEYEALKRQKETLDKTYSEFEGMCNSLTAECNNVKNSLGSVNGFAQGYGDVSVQRVEETKSKVLQKIIDMTERIQNQMDKCAQVLADAQEKLNCTQRNINNAKNDLKAFNNELKQAEEEAALGL